MRGPSDYLFVEESLDDQLRARLSSLQGAVDSVSKDQFLVSTDDQLVAHFEAKSKIAPLVLHEESRTMTQAETQIDVSGDPRRGFLRGDSGPFYVPGTRVEISIPFVGEPWIFKYRTNPWSTMFPRGEIVTLRGQGVLKITLAQPTDIDPQAFKQGLDEQMRWVREYVERSTKQIEEFNQQIAGRVRSAVQDRRRRLEQHSGIAALLDIPLADKPGSPSVKPVDIQTRPLPKLPVPPKTGLTPEPGVSSETFEKILSVIRHEGRTFETTPTTFVKLSEEELRNILLAHLNGHFQGKAAGEVFRRSGKTDIRIEEDSRSAFVGECKIWGGAGQVAGDLDQLLGYLTWRDSKASLIVFNKTVKGFTALQDSLVSAIKGHKCFLNAMPCNEAGEWRFSMRSIEDEGRRVTLHVFFFNIYADATGSGPRIRST